MKKYKYLRLLVFVVCTVFAVAGSLAQDLQARGKEIVSQLAAREFNKVEARFDATMFSLMPSAKLAETWDVVLAQAGSFKSIQGTRQEEVQGHHLVFVTSQFEQTSLDIKLAFNTSGQVAGLFFVPVRSQTDASKPAAGPLKLSDVTGDWIGTLDTGALKLRIVFHITNTTDGLKATMDSPDQSVSGIAASAVRLDGSSVTVEVARINGVFEGKASSDLATLDGTWKQGPGSAPLKLKRVQDAKSELAPPSRPQNPQKPYPYREEDVIYDNKSAGNKLAGTLTIPTGKGPFPAVVLITGSGPQDRDESLMGHKPFLVLSDYLTRQGIAVLRVDDRGVAKSTGDFATATTADFATDTEAGIAYLKTRPEVDAKKIGLIGHSEGGVIAPMIAARNRDVAFIVMLAGSGVPGDQIIVAQTELISEASGMSHDQAMKAGARQGEFMDLIRQTSDQAALEKQLHEKLAPQMPEAQIGAAIRQLTSPWLRYFINYDPAIALRKVTCPVLALNGGKDLQVPPKQNLPAIRKALEAAGNKDFETDELPGLNHLFQTAKTGSPSEYAQIEETMSPVALEKIAGWILKR
jgi:uncharacterized protein